MSRRSMAAVLALLLPATGWTQVRVGSEIQVNVFTSGEQWFPAVGSDGDGNFVVVWHSSIPGEFGVFGRRYLAAGTAVDATGFLVSEGTTSIVEAPAVASDPNGPFVVVWPTYTVGSDYEVWARTYDGAGTPGGALHVNTYTTNAQSVANVATDAIGNFVVVWQSLLQDGSANGIFARRYDSFGAPRSGAFRVNSETNNHQSFPAVASDAFGNFVVVWASVNQDGDSGGIFGQRYDAVGAVLGAEFRVNSYTPGSQGFAGVASTPTGEFVVVWQGPDGSGTGVFAQRYDPSGVAQGAEFRVNTFTTADQLEPSVAADAHGFVVAWSSFGQDNSSYAVVARRFGPGGVAQGGEFVVNSFTTNRQRAPSVATGAHGTFVVTWMSLSQDGDSYGVFAQSFLTDLIFEDGFE